MLSTYFVFGVQAVLAQDDEELNWRHRQYLKEIENAKNNIDNYKGGTYLAGEEEEKWLQVAVSTRKRDKWATHELLQPHQVKVLDKALNDLSAAAAKKFSLHKPKAQNFTFRHAANEELLKAALDNIADLKIHKIGFIHEDWQRDGNNSPFKKGFIWARDTSDDHSYCHLFRITIYQDYVGNGQFIERGTPGTLQDDILVSCP